MSEQANLRADVTRAINAWDAWARATATQRMVERFKVKFAASGLTPTVFALYMPMADEPDFRGLAHDLVLLGHRVVHPTMRPDADGKGGVLEFEGLSPAEIDVMVVPGRVFGEAGERVGRGRGYYDRYFSGCEPGRPLRVALAFELQVRAVVPQNPWDARMDWIVTEKREIQAAAP